MDTRCIVIEEETQFTLLELSRVCDVQAQAVFELVAHGVIDPLGDTHHAWRFGGDSLRRTRVALRLIRELGVNPAGAALALELMAQVEELRARVEADRLTPSTAA